MGAAFAFCYKQFDLRWSRLVTGRIRRPRLRIFTPVPVDQPRTRPPGTSRTSSGEGLGSKPSLGLGPPRGAARRSPRRGPGEDRPRGPRRPDRGGPSRAPRSQSPRPRQAERSPLMSLPLPPLPLIRDAVPADRPTIVEFNRLLAVETEDKVLDLAILDQGVARALAEPDRLPLLGCRDRGPPGRVSSARRPSHANGATGETAGSGGSRASTFTANSAARASSRPCTGTSTTRPWHIQRRRPAALRREPQPSAPSRPTRPWE